MAGLPIELMPNLLQMVTNLLFVSDVKYKYTWDIYTKIIDSNLPKIVDIPEDKNDYRIIIENLSDEKIYLHLGTDLINKFEKEQSAFFILPKSTFLNEQKGGVIYAFSESPSNVRVTIHSTKKNLLTIKEMPIPLNIKLIAGTGDNYGQDFPLPIFRYYSRDIYHVMKDILDSDRGITGHKIIHLSSFQPGDTYTFKLITPNNTDMYVQSSIKKPIHIHLIDQLSLAKGLGSFISFLQGRGGYSNEMKNAFQQIIGIMKGNNYITSLPTGESEFSITPSNFSAYIHIGVTNQSGSDACVITNYDEATRTITVGGY